MADYTAYLVTPIIATQYEANFFAFYDAALAAIGVDVTGTEADIALLQAAAINSQGFVIAVSAPASGASGGIWADPDGGFYQTPDGSTFNISYANSRDDHAFSGVVTFRDSAVFEGGIRGSGPLDVASDGQVGGSMNIGGNGDVGGDWTVTGDTVLSGTATIDGTLTLNSNQQFERTTAYINEIEGFDFYYTSSNQLSLTAGRVRVDDGSNLFDLHMNDSLAMSFAATSAPYSAVSGLTPSQGFMYCYLIHSGLSAGDLLSTNDFDWTVSQPVRTESMGYRLVANGGSGAGRPCIGYAGFKVDGFRPFTRNNQTVTWDTEIDVSAAILSANGVWLDFNESYYIPKIADLLVFGWEHTNNNVSLRKNGTTGGGRILYSSEYWDWAVATDEDGVYEYQNGGTSPTHWKLRGYTEPRR